jgi:ubiquitin-like protein Pup
MEGSFMAFMKESSEQRGSSSAQQEQEAQLRDSADLGQVKAPQSQEEADSLDSLLDDIESSLETNAEEYVQRFVQKGGE